MALFQVDIEKLKEHLIVPSGFRETWEEFLSMLPVFGV